MVTLASLRPQAGHRSFAMAAALAVAVCVLVWVGSCVIGVQELPWDDNYMTYIYGRNLAEGFGLRFNATDQLPIEGYSSLSHVLLVALADRLGLDPLAATRGIGLAFFVMMPLVIGLPLSRLTRAPTLGTLAITYSAQILYFLSTATTVHLNLGMETIIFMGSLACMAGWSLGEFEARDAAPRSIVWRVISGILAAVCVGLGRPEGPFLVMVTLGTVYLSGCFLFPGLRARDRRAFIIVAAGAATALLGYLGWKLLYFGDLLPNPYYVKTHNAIMGMSGSSFPGWSEIRSFSLLILPWVAGGIPLYLLAGDAPREKRALLLSAIPGAAMVLMYAKVIHEAAPLHRYEFPSLVYLQLPLAGLACLVARRMRLLPLAVVAAAVATVPFSAVRMELLKEDPKAWLTVRAGETGFIAVAVGKDLARTGLGQQATIALSAAGAIPYFSGFRAIDLVGLNDRYLSGRTPHSIADVWRYVDSFKPDVLQSGLPPATPGFGLDRHDPVLDAPGFINAISMESNELQKHWDPAKVLERARRESMYIREHYTFGGLYHYIADGSDGWIVLYIRKDSPRREQIRSALQYFSLTIDRETDVQEHFVNDPRRL